MIFDIKEKREIITNHLSFDVGRPAKENTLQIDRVERTGRYISKIDAVATEEPLEIRVLTAEKSEWVKHSVAVTMRTPGNDFELSAGFLLSEGVVKGRENIVRISYCTDPNEIQRYNVVNVYLSANTHFDEAQLSRHTYTSSSCGICGKGSIEQVRVVCNHRPVGEFKFSSDVLLSLPNKLRNDQNIFNKTGGLHASALFDRTGKLIKLREDVGRHNALDKVVGSLLLNGELPASDTLLLLSGRASFELVQKAAIAGIPFICAVGAPSNLAIDLARDYGMTLIGFLKDDCFNIYSGNERIILSSHN